MLIFARSLQYIIYSTYYSIINLIIIFILISKKKSYNYLLYLFSKFNSTLKTQYKLHSVS